MKTTPIGTVARAGGIVMPILLCACMSFPVKAAALESQSDENTLARGIRETVERIHAVRIERLRVAERHQAALSETDRRIERLKDDIARTETALEKEKESVDVLVTESLKGKERKQAIENILADATALVLPQAREMRKRVLAGIPFRKQQREERIGRIIDGLQDRSPKTAAEALGDYMSFAAEELRLADSVNLWNEPALLEQGARQIQAYQIRVGLLAQFFVSEDGRAIGIADGKQASGWNMGPNRAQRRRIYAILDILRKRSPPELVPVPFDIPEKTLPGTDKPER